MIDPGLRTLEIFARDASGRGRLDGVMSGGDRVRAGPFDAVELQLALLWGAPASASRPAER